MGIYEFCRACMFFSSYTKHGYMSNNSGSKRDFQNNKIPVWTEFRKENQMVVFILL